MTINELNNQYAIEDCIIFIDGPFPMVQLSTHHGKAIISLYGAHLLSCTLKSQELLFVSQKAIFIEGTPIRGGVPICWPWFGPDPQNLGRSDHGLARTRMWYVVSTACASVNECSITLELTDTPETYALWPHHFHLTLKFSISDTVTLELTTKNLGNDSFELTQALHTYFSVGNIAQTHITGLEDSTYIDKIDSDCQIRQNGPIVIDAETDRIYLNDGSDIVIHDDAQNRKIRIECEESKTAVVWNPWIRVCEQKADLEGNDYQKMVCVETTNASYDIITLNTGESHTLKAIYSLI